MTQPRCRLCQRGLIPSERDLCIYCLQSKGPALRDEVERLRAALDSILHLDPFANDLHTTDKIRMIYIYSAAMHEIHRICEEALKGGA